MKRILTALVLIPFALYAIFWAPHWIFVAIVALMATACYHEFAGIAANSGAPGPLWIGFVLGYLFLFDPGTIRLLPLVALTLALRLADLSKVLAFSTSLALGVVYVFGAWRCAIDLRAISPFWILFALSINWVGDIAAFYVGRTFGKHKLSPRVSPGKSWEGAVGSLVAVVAFGIAFEGRLGLGLSVPEMIGLSVLCNVAGQVGDLAESSLKRGAGLKDSGTLLPGHGGFLDRLDSSLFTMPMVFYFLQYRALV
ncbi:MAG TPA: phosphatidate cytidylyltransferase [Bryobacteraceae bacterium]|nr:phosphatidate cytidylyltransferase [Bryobacteraceae bacterium]